MALIWDAFLEDYEDEIENSSWDLREILRVFWHYSQDGKKGVDKLLGLEQSPSKERINYTLKSERSLER